MMNRCDDCREPRRGNALMVCDECGGDFCQQCFDSRADVCGVCAAKRVIAEEEDPNG